MSDCLLCGILQGKSPAEKIYEDTKCIAIVPPAPAAPGHIILIPKPHYQILEQIPDYELAHLFKVANKLSVISFETVQAKGTNIMINNGVAAGQVIPHVTIHIIPRNEGDNIEFQWNPKQLTEEQMSTVELKLKEGSSGIGKFQKEEKKEPIKLEKKPEKVEEPKKGENYLIKQLKRIP